jgi:hypothetical protein
VISSNDPLAKVLLPVTSTLYSAGLEVLVPEAGMLPLEDITTISLNGGVKTLSSHFGLSLPLNQQEKTGAMFGALILTTKEKLSYYSKMEIYKEYF